MKSYQSIPSVPVAPWRRGKAAWHFCHEELPFGSGKKIACAHCRHKNIWFEEIVKAGDFFHYYQSRQTGCWNRATVFHNELLNQQLKKTLSLSNYHPAWQYTLLSFSHSHCVIDPQSYLNTNSQQSIPVLWRRYGGISVKSYRQVASFYSRVPLSKTVSR